MIERPVDYARLDYEWRAHHVRFKRFIQEHRPRLLCQDCGGAGGEKEPILDDGSGPWYDCGWCEGTGYMTPYARGFWLRCKREEKAQAKATIDRRAVLESLRGSDRGV